MREKTCQTVPAARKPALAANFAAPGGDGASAPASRRGGLAAHGVAAHPLAVRAPPAAAMLGISESKLRGLVADGRIRPPVAIDGLRLFDVEQLRADWSNLRDAALADGGPNPWDDVASSLGAASQSKS